MKGTVDKIVDISWSLKDRFQAWKASQAQPLSEGQETGVTTDYVNFRRGSTLERDKVYERVRAKVEKLFGFYSHLAVYVVVNVFLLSSTVAVLWGIGLFFHAFGVFGSRYKERMIEKMVKKEMGKQGISGTNEPIK